jgi:hypothetical protein
MQTSYFSYHQFMYIVMSKKVKARMPRKDGSLLPAPSLVRSIELLAARSRDGARANGKPPPQRSRGPPTLFAEWNENLDVLMCKGRDGTAVVRIDRQSRLVVRTAWVEGREPEWRVIWRWAWGER